MVVAQFVNTRQGFVFLFLGNPNTHYPLGPAGTWQNNFIGNIKIEVVEGAPEYNRPKIKTFNIRDTNNTTYVTYTI
jgi:hypothetical protein